MSFKKHLETTKVETELKQDIDKVLDKHQVDAEFLHKMYPVENNIDTEKD